MGPLRVACTRACGRLGLREQTSATSLAMGGSHPSLPLALVAVRIPGRQGEPGERSDRNSLMTGNVDRDPGGTWGTHRAEPGYRPRYLDQHRHSCGTSMLTCLVFDGVLESKSLLGTEQNRSVMHTT